MKKITQKMIENVNGVIGRAIIDRRRNTDIAIMEETRAIDREFGSKLTPSALYNYYISISCIPMWDLTNDAKVAKQLGHTVRAVADTRRKLVSAGWILFEVHNYQGTKHGLWYIGKEVVSSKLASTGTTSLEELKGIGVILESEYNTAKEFEDIEYSQTS